MITREDLRQIDVEEAIKILHNNPHGFIHTWGTDDVERVKPAVFYIEYQLPIAIDVDEYNAEQLLNILYTYYLYTQDVEVNK